MQTRFTSRYLGLHTGSKGETILAFEAPPAEAARAVLLLGYMHPSRPFQLLMANDGAGFRSTVRLIVWEFDGDRPWVRFEVALTKPVETFTLNAMYRKAVVIDARETGDAMASDDPGAGLDDDALDHLTAVAGRDSSIQPLDVKRRAAMDAGGD